MESHHPKDITHKKRWTEYLLEFYMTDGTLSQLKNSGGLRMIRNNQVVDSLQSYANSYREFELDQQLEGEQIKDYRNSLIKIFDANVFNEMVKSYPEITRPVTE